ncbi:MAG: AMP-binding protein [Bdellovibrionia bacterium]
MGTTLDTFAGLSEIDANPIDWDSLSNHAYLNPRLPEQDTKRLRSLVESVSDQFRAHVFLLSSGTSGGVGQDLKWVALSKAALLTSAIEVNRHLKSDSGVSTSKSTAFSSKDVWLHVLPDFHVGGLGIRARSYLSGAKVVRLSLWDPKEFVSLAISHDVTLASLVPAQVYDLVQNGLKSPASMRAVLVGGGALAPSLRLKARELGWPLLITYGMTEACSQIATSSLDSALNSSLAPELELLPHWAARPCGDGRIQIQGDSLFTAYVYSGSKGEAVVWDPREDGWFSPQDIVSIEGRKLEVLGRTQDLIKIGGENVDLARLRLILENIKTEINLIADIALISVPDARLGHVIHLVSDRSLTNECASALIEIFNQRVVAFERIRKWSRLELLPRTSLGKFISNHESLLSMGTEGTFEVSPSLN